jgi:hypothetical protein
MAIPNDYQHRIEVNGVSIFAGRVRMSIPQGGSHLREALITLPRFKKRPVITATVSATDSPGDMFYFYSIQYIDHTGSSGIKFSAQSLRATGNAFNYMCDFTAVGEVGDPAP